MVCKPENPFITAPAPPSLPWAQTAIFGQQSSLCPQGFRVCNCSLGDQDVVGLKGHRLASLTKIGDSNPLSRTLGGGWMSGDCSQGESAPVLTGSLELFEKLHSFPQRIHFEARFSTAITMERGRSGIALEG